MIWLGIAAVVLVLIGLLVWWRSRPAKMPDAWPLAARKVFTRQEQDAYAIMRSAFPDHAVLVKLPVSRFLYLTETRNMKYWFELLTPLYVTFAVCRADGKVIAAVDFDSAQQKGSRSGYTLKRRALDACKLLYLRYDYEAMPSAKVLRLNVLGDKAPDISIGTDVKATAADAASGTASGSANAAPAVRKVKDPAVAAREAELARQQLEQIVKDRRHDMNKREARDSGGEAWAPDSIMGRDSFLRPDSRIDPEPDDKVDLVLH